MEADETLEPPLCSCRMETPKNQDVVKLAEGKCMAVEGVDGKVLFSHSWLPLHLSLFPSIPVSLPGWNYFRFLSFLLPVYYEFWHILFPLSPPIAEFMSKTDPEAGDDAPISADPVVGAVWGSPGWYGQTPELPWMWSFLQSCKYSLRRDQGRGQFWGSHLIQKSFITLLKSKSGKSQTCQMLILIKTQIHAPDLFF